MQISKLSSHKSSVINGICFNSFSSEVPASETDNEDEHKNDPVQTKVDELLEEKVEPITLRQGKY